MKADMKRYWADLGPSEDECPQNPNDGVFTLVIRAEDVSEPVAWMARFRGRFGNVDWTPWSPIPFDPSLDKDTEWRLDKETEWESFPLYAMKIAQEAL